MNLTVTAKPYQNVTRTVKTSNNARQPIAAETASNFAHKLIIGAAIGSWIIVAIQLI